MVLYNFKSIQVVPTGKDFVDIVLSTTQSKTPTEVHKHFEMARIRSFYIRKVKFVQQTYHDKLTKILEDFPVLDDLHPFYADLLNVLYDKDHYKLALAQLNTARRLIDNLAQEHVRFVKFGDSLYRCKQLKRAALGRMCTIIRQQSASLAYLEQVRQHLARLPNIDPSTRTILITGYPNVGKSSMMNKLTNANVDVQPYAFTTKSLFVGHMDYNYLRWQVIDSPGILDHPLEDRNTIEMQAITALAHLRCAVLFVLDISAKCGYTIKQQVALFDSLKPLFANKPVVLALNKVDAQKYDELDPEDRSLIEGLVRGHALPSGELPVIHTSSLTEIGLVDVKQKVCDLLLAQRTEMKMQGKSHTTNILNRLHLATPQPRDSRERPAFIPESVIKAREAKAAAATDMELPEGPKKTLAQLEAEKQLTAGLMDWADRSKDTENYLLADPQWKHDVIPEIIEGKNIADFVDADIWERLDELEKEEEAMVAQEELEHQQDDFEPLTSEQQGQLEMIRERKELVRVMGKKKNHEEPRRFFWRTAAANRPKEDFADHLMAMGVEADDARDTSRNAARSASRARSASVREGRKRKRAESRDVEDAEKRQKRSRSKSELRKEKREERERALAPTPGSGFKDSAQRMKAMKLARQGIRERNKESRAGEGDRVITTKMPKHLFSGKRKAGKTQRR